MGRLTPKEIKRLQLTMQEAHRETKQPPNRLLTKSPHPSKNKIAIQTHPL